MRDEYYSTKSARLRRVRSKQTYLLYDNDTEKEVVRLETLLVAQTFAYCERELVLFPFVLTDRCFMYLITCPIIVIVTAEDS